MLTYVAVLWKSGISKAAALVSWEKRFSWRCVRQIIWALSQLTLEILKGIFKNHLIWRSLKLIRAFPWTTMMSYWKDRKWSHIAFSVLSANLFIHKGIFLMPPWPDYVLIYSTFWPLFVVFKYSNAFIVFMWLWSTLLPSFGKVSLNYLQKTAKLSGVSFINLRMSFTCYTVG